MKNTKNPQVEQPKGVIVGIKPIEIGSMEVKIRGLSPLLVHRWSEKAVREMVDGQAMTKEQKKKAREKPRVRNTDAEYMGSRHVINGKDCFPTSGLKMAMCDAGYALGIAKSIIRQAVFLVGDYFVIETKNGPTKREDTVRIGPFNKRGADLRYRAEYDNWQARLEIQFRKDMITPDQVVALLQNAGFSVGIGEWRPQKNGQFGRFTVK